MQHNYSLAFVAGLKRATDEGSLPEIAQYSPYYLPLNVFTASKGSNLYILFTYFEGMVNQIYPPEFQLNKANISDTEAPFLDLHLSVANGFVSSKLYDKRDDFDFDIVNFPFWMVTFLVVLLMVYTFRNLLGLLESAIMLQTSTLEINV